MPTLRHTRSRFWFLFCLIVIALILSSVGWGTQPVRAANNGLGTLPLMGWSSWSLESTTHPGYGIPFLTAQNLMKQSDDMHQKLQSAGYNYVNIDSGWWMDASWTGGAIQGDEYDTYGRPTPDATRFPSGLKDVIHYINANGQHVGLYYVVGLPKAVYAANPPIFGTSCHAQDIALQPVTATNGWQDHWAINFNNPCAQAYIDSIADQFAEWGIDFLKLDGVTDDNQADVKAWSLALQQTRRPIWLTLSWSLDRTLIGVWKQYANAARISGDVECYCSTLVTWSRNVVTRFNDAPAWVWYVDAGYKNEFDSLDIGVSALDGLTKDERQSYMTLWAISGANLLVGDDLALLDSDGIALLTNKEVIAQNQTGKAARPVSQLTEQQVWWVQNVDGSYTVALFNLSNFKPYTVTANWSSFGLEGMAAVHDLWSHADLGSYTDSWSASLPPHGSQLIRVTPDNTSSASKIYEAEAAIWSGTAIDHPCAACSGAEKVAGIGDNSGVLMFTVNVHRAGTYILSIRYMNGDSSAHNLYLSVNDGSRTPLTFEPTGTWFASATLTTTVNLNSGSNTVRFYNPNAGSRTIDLDLISLPMSPSSARPAF